MATRSTIAKEYPNGTIKQIYCHWDGYLAHNGIILLKYYSDQDKLDQLIEMGDLSVLKPEIGVTRPFENPFDFRTPEHIEFDNLYRNQCVFFGRDGGSLPSEVNAQVYTDFNVYLKNADSIFKDYNYINRAGTWYVDTGESGDIVFIDLSVAVLMEKLST